MAGFISNPPNSIASPPAPANDVEGDGFYPGLKLADFRDAMRLPAQTTDLRLREAVTAAIVTVTRDLVAWKVSAIAAGATALEDIANGEVAGEPLTVFLYRRAVYCYAAAELADTHHDIAASAEGAARVEDRTPAAEELRRNGLHAIRDLLGLGRITCELI